MTDFKTYLKAAVISDGEIITYRQLSRALRVHVNSAKAMLYDFYADLNSKKSGSIHATYLISGLRKPSENDGPKRTGAQDEDELMQSSPFDSKISDSKGPEVDIDQSSKSVRSVVLTPEEKFEDVKASFEIIYSIHIYSVEPTPPSDLMVLSDSAIEVRQKDSGMTPVERSKIYGIIVNPIAKPRTDSILPQPVAPVENTTPNVIKVDPKDPKRAEIMKSIMGKKAAASVTPSMPSGRTENKKIPASSVPKRSHTDFFRSFGSGPKKGEESPMTKKGALRKEVSPEPEDASSKMDIDEPSIKPTPNDDDEGEEEAPEIPCLDAAKEAEAAEARRKREEALRRMMDSDEEEHSPPKSKPSAKLEPTASMKGLSKRLKSESPPPSAQRPPSSSPPDSAAETGKAAPVSQETSSTSRSGKRRGKRMVTKKVFSQDIEGYLVTKTDTVWESFSEDDTPTPAPAPKPKTTTLVKGKGGPKGQGNIMNFFTKK